MISIKPCIELRQLNFENPWSNHYFYKPVKVKQNAWFLAQSIYNQIKSEKDTEYIGTINWSLQNREEGLVPI